MLLLNFQANFYTVLTALYYHDQIIYLELNALSFLKLLSAYFVLAWYDCNIT